MTWLKEQFEWLKSFFEEPNEEKASNKRALSTLVVVVFCVAYLKIAIPAEEVIDMPFGWGLMIGAILGLNIADRWIKLKMNGNGSKTTDVQPK